MPEEAVIAESAPAAVDPVVKPDAEAAPPDPFEGLTREQKQKHIFDGTTPTPKPKAAPQGGSEAESAPAGEDRRTPEQIARSRRDKERNERKWNDQQRELGRLQAENELLKSGKKADSAPAAEAPKEPRLADFQDPDEWAKAHREFLKADIKRELAEEAASAERTKGEAENEKAWTSGVAEIAKEHADFEAVAYSEDLPLSKLMIDEIRGRGKDGAALLYALGKNTAEAKRITDMTVDPELEALAKSDPKQFAFALGRLIATAKYELDLFARSIPAPQADDPQVQKLKLRTNAPEPVRSVGGRAQSPGDPIAAALKAKNWKLFNELSDAALVGKR